MNKFSKYIELAHALFNPDHELRTFHVSFVLYKNRIVSVGINNVKTSPVNLKNPRYGRGGENISTFKGSCSEWVALSKLKNMTNIPFGKCVLINVRLNKNKQIAISKPCDSCASLLEFFDIRKVFFTTNNGVFEQYEG